MNISFIGTIVTVPVIVIMCRIARWCVDESFVIIVPKDPDEATNLKNENPAQEIQAFLDEIPVNKARMNILIKMDSSRP